MIDTKISDISKCLTEEVIRKAFMQKTNSHDKVRLIELSRAAASGDGLLSVVYRIHVTGYEHSATFIVKGLIKNLQLRRSLLCTTFFAREGKFFTDVLPALSEVQELCGATERIQDYIPKLYSCCLDGENDYILLEDLAASGYTSLPEDPTEDDRNKALKTLAHFHAVSFALRITKPEVFEDIARSIPELFFTEYNRKWYRPYQKNAIAIDRQVVREYFDSSSEYYKRFENIVSNDIYGNLINSVQRSEKHPVICHGDAWCPNFLCSEDKATVIDFQILRCASVATDLVVLILMCSNLCKKKQDFINAVELYYSSLSYFLEDMGFQASKVFSRQDLDDELKEYGKFGFMACLTSIPLMAGERFDNVKSEKTPVSEQERFPLEKLWKLSPIKDEHKNRLVNVLRVCVDLGLI